MIKVFCDRCGDEIESQSHPMKYTRMRHISRGSLTAHSKMINGEWHNFSGADDTSQLCLPCYNDVMYAAETEFKKTPRHVKEKTNY